MTYNVPYSFVPGTKAKAEEVNANFIDVLDKIENTNDRLSEISTSTTSEINNLTSITDELKTTTQTLEETVEDNYETLSSDKADLSTIDGLWTEKVLIIAENYTVKQSTSYSFSLSSYLPDDENTYEVMFGMMGITGSSSGCSIDVRLYSTDYITSGYGCPMLYAVARSGATYADSGSCIFPVGKNRKITIKQYSGNSTSATVQTLTAFGYRKVR